MELVSIIVPVFNVEQYIDRCIKSLLLQTYSNLEIILIDDGSTDKSGEIIDYWSREDKRITVFHRENVGLSATRNFGIEVSNGDFLCFVDSDDCVHESFVESLYTLLVETSSDIACIGIRQFYDETELNAISYNDSKFEVFNKLDSIYYLYNDEKYGNYACNKIYKRYLFESIKFPIGRKMEDLGVIYLLFDLANTIAYCDKELYYYYQRSDSILHVVDYKFYRDKYEMVKERYLYVKEKYPMLEINYLFYFECILDLYIYLTREERQIEKEELKSIWGLTFKKLKLKLKIKALLMRFFGILYYQIMKWRKRNE